MSRHLPPPSHRARVIGTRHPAKTVSRRPPKASGTPAPAEAALSALDLVLGAIAAPAIVVDVGGTVLHANSNARTLIARDSRGVAQSLVRAMAGAPADLAWDLTPLRGGEGRRGFLAILRGRSHGPQVAGSLAVAVRRWHLTPRQAAVLDLVARGFTNALIAEELGIGEGTVEFHVSAIFDKAGVESRTMLIARVHVL